MHRVMRVLGAFVATCATALMVVIALATPAAADGAGGAVTNNSGIDYGALSGSRAGGNHSNGSSGRETGPVCTYQLMGAAPMALPILGLDGDVIPMGTGTDGSWYEEICDGMFYGAVYLNSPAAAVDPAAVAAGVMKRLDIPLPDVALSPSGDQIVNLASWFWIPNWQTLNGTATVGGVTVHVTARPRAARWTFGDGTESSCSPGIPWAVGAESARACTHTWLRSSAAQSGESYRLTVTVTWNASYTVVGGAGGGALAPLTRTTTAAVRVAEVQAINDRAGG